MNSTTDMDLPELEKKHVVDVYSQITKHFDQTRYRAWPSIEKFVKSFPEGTEFLEVGSGNGKNMMLRPDSFKGCDICEELVDLCTEKGLDVVVVDAASLPYDDDSFDVCISVAVLHHLSTQERRVEAIKEMLRVVRPGGRLLVEVWCLEDNNRAVNGEDSMISWESSDKTVRHLRYYHFFSKEDILNVVKMAGCVVDDIKWEKFNWIIYMTKKLI